jgi:hypothetical protein
VRFTSSPATGVTPSARTSQPFTAPLGWLPLPSRWSVRFGEPVAAPAPALADDPAAVAAAGEAVRAELQRMLDADLAGRRSIFV